MARHIHRAKLLNVNGELIRYIGYQEAVDMVECGEAMRLSRLKAGQLVIKLRQARTPDRVKNEASITFAEMQANAGVRGCRRRSKRRGYVGNFVDRAMTKIKLWPLIGDTRAVRVGPRT